MRFSSNYSNSTEILNAKPTHTDLCIKPTLSLTLLIFITILNMCVCKCYFREYCVWLIMIMIIIIIITFMQGIYTYIPETNYVPREYSVAAILLLLFMVLISLVSLLNILYFYISTFRSMCAVPNMAVFWSSSTSCFPVMLLTYFLNDFELVPVAPIITDITFVFTFHMRCIYFVRSLYFLIFSACFLITFLSPEIATSINIHVPFSLSRIIMSGLLLGIVLSVCTCWLLLLFEILTLCQWLI